MDFLCVLAPQEDEVCSNDAELEDVRNSPSKVINTLGFPL